MTRKAKRYICMYSGGIGSYEAARRIALKSKNVELLFADTLIEDPDLYRFLDESSVSLGLRVTRLVDGRNPWQLFREERFIGNSQKDLCSRILKREICDKWLTDNCDPRNTIVVLGLDWTEEHRVKAAAGRYEANGWRTQFPLMTKPMFDKNTALKNLTKQGLKLPRLYEMGFSHNNCGGFCIKAGHGHFKKLLRLLPDVYARHEIEEKLTIIHNGGDHAVLKDRRGKKTVPMTLKALRLRIEADRIKVDDFDIGGCGCFSPTPD